MSTLPRKCEAAAMDFGFFGVGAPGDGLEHVEPVPPCDNDAEIGCRGYWLCRGCFDALALIVDIAGRMPPKDGPHD